MYIYILLTDYIYKYIFRHFKINVNLAIYKASIIQNALSKLVYKKKKEQF